MIHTLMQAENVLFDVIDSNIGKLYTEEDYQEPLFVSLREMIELADHCQRHLPPASHFEMIDRYMEEVKSTGFKILGIPIAEGSMFLSTSNSDRKIALALDKESNVTIYLAELVTIKKLKVPVEAIIRLGNGVEGTLKKITEMYKWMMALGDKKKSSLEKEYPILEYVMIEALPFAALVFIFNDQVQKLEDEGNKYLLLKPFMNKCKMGLNTIWCGKGDLEYQQLLDLKDKSPEYFNMIDGSLKYRFRIMKWNASVRMDINKSEV